MSQPNIASHELQDCVLRLCVRDHQGNPTGEMKQYFCRSHANMARVLEKHRKKNPMPK